MQTSPLSRKREAAWPQRAVEPGEQSPHQKPGRSVGGHQGENSRFLLEAPGGWAGFILLYSPEIPGRGESGNIPQEAVLIGWGWKDQA